MYLIRCIEFQNHGWALDIFSRRYIANGQKTHNNKSEWAVKNTFWWTSFLARTISFCGNCSRATVPLTCFLSECFSVRVHAGWNCGPHHTDQPATICLQRTGKTYLYSVQCTSFSSDKVSRSQ